jgi:hypothetical protein
LNILESHVYAALGKKVVLKVQNFFQNFLPKINGFALLVLCQTTKWSFCCIFRSIGLRENMVSLSKYMSKLIVQVEGPSAEDQEHRLEESEE